MGKEEMWLAQMPAARLEQKLRKCDDGVKRRALRYFLEYEDKGRSVLERRKKKSAKLVFTTLKIIDKRVPSDDRSAAISRVKRMLLELVLSSAKV